MQATEGEVEEGDVHDGPSAGGEVQLSAAARPGRDTGHSLAVPRDLGPCDAAHRRVARRVRGLDGDAAVALDEAAEPARDYGVVRDEHRGDDRRGLPGGSRGERDRGILDARDLAPVDGEVHAGFGAAGAD